MPQTIVIDGKEIPVEQLRTDWALALMQRGVIVKIYISRWRASARISPEDLGLKFVDNASFDFAKKYISLGCQKLLPPEILNEINEIERKARITLNNFSFGTVWGRFVPSRVFTDWEKQNKIISDDFYAMALNLTTQYDQIVARVKEDYKNMARDVWARLYPESKDKPSESFVEEFSYKVISKIPLIQEITSGFKYQVTYSLILLPSILQENQLKADNIKRENEMQDFNTSIEKETKRRVAEEYIRKKSELIDGFLKSTVSSMREYVSELCDEVLKSLGRYSATDDVRKYHIKKLKRMINKVRILNFYDDKEIDKLIVELDSELNQFKGKRNNQNVSDKLRQIIDVAKKEFMPTNFNPAVGYLEIE
jgi:hypothetical protein